MTPDDADVNRPAPRLHPWAWRLVLAVQILALVGYAVLHSPLMPALARLVGVHPPDFCYFTCR